LEGFDAEEISGVVGLDAKEVERKLKDFRLEVEKSFEKSL
jgi:DNA-directed RNA polymerase specialized sigma24 family protein